MIVVSDSSPLICLAKIGEFDILRRFFNRLYIPAGVYDEVVVRGRGRAGEKEVVDSTWIRLREIKDKGLSEEIRRYYNIGRGEAEAIVLGKELSADLLLMDERRARLVAEVYGLDRIGTVGVLELGFERDLVTDLRETYVRLRAKGARIDEGLLNESLMRHGLRPLHPDIMR
ncbi:MAG: DUF3368 domain-containing protein [Candidatus Latescibacteria bacterium]|nr:DUF3368 domain-containing protein [Candidatus Latescibacterota bacterium]